MSVTKIAGEYNWKILFKPAKKNLKNIHVLLPFL